MSLISPPHSLHRHVLPGGNVTIAPRKVLIGAPGEESCDPNIQLVREGDLVRAVDVQCACGRTMRIVLEYAPRGPQGGQP